MTLLIGRCLWGLVTLLSVEGRSNMYTAEILCSFLIAGTSDLGCVAAVVLHGSIRYEDHTEKIRNTGTSEMIRL